MLKDCGAVQQVSALLIALAQNHPEDYKVRFKMMTRFHGTVLRNKSTFIDRDLVFIYVDSLLREKMFMIVFEMLPSYNLCNLHWNNPKFQMG